MNAKRLILLAIAAVLAWYFFIRRKPMPQAVVTGVPAKPSQAASNAASQTIQTAANAAQPYIAQITGQIFNGIAQSIGQYGQGGSNGADTGSTSDWGSIDPMEVYQDPYYGTGYEF